MRVMACLEEAWVGAVMSIIVNATLQNLHELERLDKSQDERRRLEALRLLDREAKARESGGLRSGVNSVPRPKPRRAACGACGVCGHSNCLVCGHLPSPAFSSRRRGSRTILSCGSIVSATRSRPPVPPTGGTVGAARVHPGGNQEEASRLPAVVLEAEDAGDDVVCLLRLKNKVGHHPVRCPRKRSYPK